jgi:hypothetical protein
VSPSRCHISVTLMKNSELFTRSNLYNTYLNRGKDSFLIRETTLTKKRTPFHEKVWKLEKLSLNYLPWFVPLNSGASLLRCSTSPERILNGSAHPVWANLPCLQRIVGSGHLLCQFFGGFFICQEKSVFRGKIIRF